MNPSFITDEHEIFRTSLKKCLKKKYIHSMTDGKLSVVYQGNMIKTWRKWTFITMG